MSRATMQPRKAFGVIRDIGSDANPRGFGGIATDGTLDRCSDIVVPEGGDVSQFRQNPVLVDSHDTGTAANIVGTVPWINLIGRQWKFRAEFLPEGMSALADELCARVKCGALGAVSIGFIPEEWEYMNGGGVRYTKWSLIELSLCAVPANPSALVTERSVSGGSTRAAHLARAAQIRTELNLPDPVQIQADDWTARNLAYARAEDDRIRDRRAAADAIARSLQW